MTSLPAGLVIGAGIGMCGGMAVLFLMTVSVFMMPIIADLGWRRSQVSLLMTAGFLGYAIGSPVLGFMFDKFGARSVLIAGIVSLAIGLLLLGALALTPVQAALLALGIGFVGAATAPSGYSLIIALSTDRRLGLVLGLSMLGYGVGVTLMPIAAQQLIVMLGWRGAYVALAGVAAVLGGVALLVGVGRNMIGRTVRQGSVQETGITLGNAVRDYRFWVIGLTAMMLSLAGFGVTAHLAAIVLDRGSDSAMAARAVGALGAGMFVGRIIAAVSMDRIFAPFVAATCTLSGAAGLLMLLAAPEQVMVFFIAAFLIGVLTGGEGDSMPFLTRRYFGTRSFGAIFGCIIGLAGMGGIVGPFAFGWTFDKAATYAPALTASLILCMISSGLFLSLGSYRYPATDQA